MQQNFFLLCVRSFIISLYAITSHCSLQQCNTFDTCVAIPCHKTGGSDRSFGKSFFSIRPQDSNSALRVTKIAHEEHAYDYWWGLDCSVGVQHTFFDKKNLLAKWFLFNGCNTISIGTPNGSQTFDVDGGQFGLMTEDGAPGIIGTLSLNPSIRNTIVTFNTWFDLESWICGLWSRIYLTLANTRTNLGMHCRTIDLAQSGTYPPGAYTTTCNTAPLAYTSICAAFVGDQAFGAIPALYYGKFYTDSKEKTALASIRFDLNYDIVRSPDGFFNWGGCVIIPTGNKPHGRYLLEPIVGANRSWQIGTTLLGLYTFLDNSENKALDLYFDATLTYLLKSKQTRVFSLQRNGAGSQYMLLKVFDMNNGVVQAGERVANIFAGKANIGGNVMFDSSLLLHYKHCNGVSLDVGYNYWARSREHIGKTVCLKNFTKNTYGIKGDLPLSITDTFSDLCIGDLTTASNATIGNPGSPDNSTQVLDVCDIDFTTPLHPFACSNKIFAALGYSYSFCECDSLDIDFFVEGEVEFGQRWKALNQWAISINVAISV